MQFDDDADKYQENLFFNHNPKPMGNQDIIESVGLEYVHQSYEKPQRKGAKERKPFKVDESSHEHQGSVEAPLDS